MAKKRANGEGSIRKKPSGRWEGRYTQGIDPVTGRAIQKSVSAKTQAECKEKLAKAIRENRGVPLNHTGDYTAAEWCRLWFETYSKPNIRYNTAKGYEGIIEHHIIPAIGTIKLKQLSSIHIQRMYNDLKENGRMQRGSKQNDKPLSNTFVRRVHAVLQAALKQAVKERLIPYNPCENCRIPPKDKKEMTILPPEKIGRYLQEAEKYGVLPMFYLELSSGLRRGELLALQWSDLNVKERILTVNKQVTRMEGELDVTEPKTKNSVRKVALSQQAVDLLVQEHEQHPDNPTQMKCSQMRLWLCLTPQRRAAAFKKDCWNCWENSIRRIMAACSPTSAMRNWVEKSRTSMCASPMKRLASIAPMLR